MKAGEEVSLLLLGKHIIWEQIWLAPFLIYPSCYKHSRIKPQERNSICNSSLPHPILIHPVTKSRSVQFSSVTQACLTLCDPVNRSTPGLPVHQQLPEFIQIHIHWVGDAIQPSHPRSSPSPPVQSLPASESFPVSQLFPWGGQSIGVSALASVLPKDSQDWSPLGWTGWISLQSKGLSRVFSNTTVQKHQFFSTQLSI